MSTFVEQASNTFNQVMQRHSINLSTSPLDFTVLEKCIIPALDQRGENLSKRFFDLVFPPLGSGHYYNYIPYYAFQKVMETGNLRFFSTKKLSSEGEFIPLCQDLGLDGYWRKNSDGTVDGEHNDLMDDLFYKSFVSSPEDTCDELWDTFAEKGTGVRLTVEVNVSPDYPDFRQVSYQGSKAVAAFNDLLNAFREAGRHFVPPGISRMPGYYQLTNFSHHKECRLIAKRHARAHDCFPFQVSRDEKQECNFIDCSLTSPTCTQFQLRVVGMEAGPKASAERRADATNIFQKFTER